jgi:hypothetical protein
MGSEEQREQRSEQFLRVPTAPAAKRERKTPYREVLKDGGEIATVLETILAGTQETRVAYK